LTHFYSGLHAHKANNNAEHGNSTEMEGISPTYVPFFIRTKWQVCNYWHIILKEKRWDPAFS